MHELMNIVETPLAHLPLETLHPGREELARILKGYA
jgi:hypothetical protein